MEKITVYTTLTDEKDALLEHPDVINRTNAEFVAFTDRPYESSTWKIKPSYDRFKDPRRNSRIHKLLAHQYIDTIYSIYLDANIRLLIPPEEVVKTYLKDHDWAMWKHPTRDCIYEEAVVCAKRGLDDPEVIIEQAVKYEKSGFGKHRGLCEGCFIVRRHTPKVEELNNMWWSEYCRHSCRDQIAFMYAADRVGLRVNSVYDPFFVVSEKVATRQSGIAEIYTHKKLTMRKEDYPGYKPS